MLGVHRGKMYVESFAYSQLQNAQNISQQYRCCWLCVQACNVSHVAHPCTSAHCMASDPVTCCALLCCLQTIARPHCAVPHPASAWQMKLVALSTSQQLSSVTQAQAHAAYQTLKMARIASIREGQGRATAAAAHVSLTTAGLAA
jgi:hypothetical protein